MARAQRTLVTTSMVKSELSTQTHGGAARGVRRVVPSVSGPPRARVPLPAGGAVRRPGARTRHVAAGAPAHPGLAPSAGRARRPVPSPRHPTCRSIRAYLRLLGPRHPGRRRRVPGHDRDRDQAALAGRRDRGAGRGQEEVAARRRCGRRSRWCGCSDPYDLLAAGQGPRPAACPTPHTASELWPALGRPGPLLVDGEIVGVVAAAGEGEEARSRGGAWQPNPATRRGGRRCRRSGWPPTAV